MQVVEKNKKRLFTYSWGTCQTSIGICSWCCQQRSFKRAWENFFLGGGQGGCEKKKIQKKTKGKKVQLCLETTFYFEDFQIQAPYSYQTAAYFLQNIKESIGILRTYATYVRKIGPRQHRIRKIGPRNKRRRRQQVGAGLKIAMAIDLCKKVAGSKLCKMMINDAISYIPTAYKKNKKNKITNKKVEAVMDTGVDDYLVNEWLN